MNIAHLASFPAIEFVDRRPIPKTLDTIWFGLGVHKTHLSVNYVKSKHMI